MVKHRLEYVQCSEDDIPSSIRFDVPGNIHRHMLEVAWGTFEHSAGVRGDPYKRVVNRAERTVTYYRLIPVREAIA